MGDAPPRLWGSQGEEDQWEERRNKGVHVRGFSGASAAAWALGPSRGPIWALYLDPDFGQVDLAGQLLAAVHVGVVRLLERALQLVELVRGEGRAVPPVLLLGLLLLRQLRVAGGGTDRQPGARPRLPRLLGAIGSRSCDEEAPDGQRDSRELSLGPLRLPLGAGSGTRAPPRRWTRRSG